MLLFETDRNEFFPTPRHFPASSTRSSLMAYHFGDIVVNSLFHFAHTLFAIKPMYRKTKTILPITIE